MAILSTPWNLPINPSLPIHTHHMRTSQHSPCMHNHHRFMSQSLGTKNDQKIWTTRHGSTAGYLAECIHQGAWFYRRVFLASQYWVDWIANWLLCLLIPRIDVKALVNSYSIMPSVFARSWAFLFTRKTRPVSASTRRKVLSGSKSKLTSKQARPNTWCATQADLCARFGPLLQALVHGESIVFAVGISMLAVGLGTGNAGFWIPGCVFMAIGFSQKSSKKWITVPWPVTHICLAAASSKHSLGITQLNSHLVELNNPNF